MKRWLCALVAPLVSSSALAIGPGQAQRGFIDGANHHIGDASFMARFGRAPDANDSEHLRMETHLQFMHDYLAARPATSPELEARRAELLGFLQDYIRKGITPHNNALPYRNPVFTDDLGHICAVGYLIEQSGRGDIVADIVANERYDLLDDIGADGIAEWIANSGFTLDELASIQPGYIAPMIEQWGTWSISEHVPKDGPWTITVAEVTTRGQWKKGKMDGAWTRTDAKQRVIGRGDFVKGKGTWSSFDENGKLIATGPFADNHPHGAWTFFYASGNVAGEGKMWRGGREGPWKFYYDAPDKHVIAAGRFANQRVSGTWSHYAQDGTLVGTTSGTSFDYTELFTLKSRPDADGITRDATSGNHAGDNVTVWAVSQGDTTLYRAGYDDAWKDEQGFVVVRLESGWFKTGCGWDNGTRRVAKRGNTLRVAEALITQFEGNDAAIGECVALEAVPAEVGAVYDALAKHEPANNDEEGAAPGDLIDMVGGNMSWYIEWPHVDGLFSRVFETLADHYSPDTVPISDQFTDEPDTSLGLVFN